MVTTKRGDNRKTRIKGVLVDKDSELVEVMGSIDELMAVLGIVMMEKTSVVLGKKIEIVNKNLYRIMGELSGYGAKVVGLQGEVRKMEKEIEDLEKKMGGVNKFLKAGGELEVWLNWARTVCRRTERRLVKYIKVHKGTDLNILEYINRLSDYLFILGRLR